MGSEKVAHLLQICVAGSTGFVAEGLVQVPTTSQIITAIQVGAQVLIALVTAYAAVKKAFQKPAALGTQTTENV